MLKKIDEDFFNLQLPWCPGISQKLFEAIRDSYKEHVVATIEIVLKENMAEALKLGNYLLPDLAETLARQRRDYGISDDYEPEFPISELKDIVREQAPTHNLAMENACGKVGHRVKKNRHLEATSRSIMLEGTKYLREKYGGSFRDYRQVSSNIKDIKTSYNKKQEQIAGEKMSSKQVNNLKIEGRLVKQLEELKQVSGPFTSSSEIESYLGNEDIVEKVKAKQMKTEVMYARDTSLSVPQDNPIFRIRTKKIPGQKSRQLTPREFGDNLEILLNKKLEASGRSISIKDFTDKIDTLKKT